MILFKFKKKATCNTSILHNATKNIYLLKKNKNMINYKHNVSILVIAFFLILTSCKKENSLKKQIRETTVDSLTTSKPEEIDKDTTAVSLSSIDCIVKSNFSLPYNQKINLEKVSYNKLNCKISGIEDFLCGEENLRYIPLPNFENNKVILIPMDCADFNYRFFLLTIFENKVVSNQYVEGEWYEPEDVSYKEITSFTIDEDYVITITTNLVENNNTSLKSKVKLQLLDDGTFNKI
jgi:hypothetical protein